MKLRQLLDDDDAVSPVIGVILMVAITVILAAVIGTFVLGLGDSVQSTTPQASFSFDFTDEATASNDELVISHSSGDAIAENQLDIKASRPSGAGGDFTLDWGTTSSKVSAGSTFTIDSQGELEQATVRLTWSSSSGDNSAVLGEWSGPDA